MERQIAMALGFGLLLAFFAAGCGGNDDDGDQRDGNGDAGGSSPDGGGDGAAWEALEDIPSGPVQETGVVQLEGKIYVVGGLPGSAVLVYDVEADEWGEAPDLPLDVHHANVAAAGGTIYVVGALLPDFRPIGNVWSWTPGDAGWSEHTSMPAGTERGAAAVGVVDGLILVAGGLAGRSVDLVSTYDPGADDWDESPPELPAPIDHGTGQTVDGVFYMIGGRTDGLDGNTAAANAYVDGSWQARSPMPTARGGIASGVVNGAIIVVGGEGNRAAESGVFARAELYDPETDQWTVLPDMRTPRHGMGAAGVGDGLYVPGGADVEGLGAVATHEVLRLP